MSGLIIKIATLMVAFFFTIAVHAQSAVNGQGIPATPTDATGEQRDRHVDENQPSGTAIQEPKLLTRTKAEEGLRIAAGDLIQVSVFGASDYTHDLRVAEDGTV